MQENLQYKVNITDSTLKKFREYDDLAWHKLMFVVLSESNENLVQEINQLKTKDNGKN
tara:strand:- start:1493 stop:1666 length:174 start_codon:yes stop_codon:yes gene_type:complete